MALLSTFDLKFRKKQYQEHTKEFWKDNVILIKKSKLFLWIYIILPIVRWMIALSMILFLIYKMTDAFNQLFYRISGFVGALWLIPNIKIIKKILDYKIDFIILTPNSLIRYDQTGFFSRSSKIIELRNLKTVSVRKTGIINSIFNNWALLFLSEGWFGKESDEDRKWSLGEIIFRYIYNPEKYKKEINRLLDLNNEWWVLPVKEIA